MTRAKAAGAAARAESNGQREVSYADLGLPGKGKFTLPGKLPFAVLRYMRSENPSPDDIVGVLETILGDQIDTLWALDIDVEGGTGFMTKLLALYGTKPGESQASPKS